MSICTVTEKDFYHFIAEAARMSKKRCQKKNKPPLNTKAPFRLEVKNYMLGGIPVTPAEMLEELKRLGINTTIKSLQRYASWGLIDKPTTKGAGKGKGKTTSHDAETATANFYASYSLVNGTGRFKAKREAVTEAREKALKAKEDGLAGMSLIFGPQPPSEEAMLALYWLAGYKDAQKQLEQARGKTKE